jgi:hypothetical protein
MAKVTQECSVNFNIHDMRRTYASAIDGVVGVYELKRLLNHAAQDSDVTSAYVVKNLDKLREPMQRVTDVLMLATHAWRHYIPDAPKRKQEPEKVVSLEVGKESAKKLAKALICDYRVFLQGLR